MSAPLTQAAGLAWLEAVASRHELEVKRIDAQTKTMLKPGELAMKRQLQSRARILSGVARDCRSAARAIKSGGLTA